MSKYLTSAFSLNMVRDDHATRTTTLSPAEAAAWIDAHPDLIHAIGHDSTAAIVSKLLDRPCPMSRITVQAGAGDEVLVAQYTGPRLDAGVTELPEGAEIVFRKVQILPA